MRCGHCKGRHETVAQARLCARRDHERRALEAQEDAQAAAECEAERRFEQWLENGGAAGERIAWEAEQDRLRTS